MKTGVLTAYRSSQRNVSTPEPAAAFCHKSPPVWLKPKLEPKDWRNATCCVMSKMAACLKTYRGKHLQSFMSSEAVCDVCWMVPQQEFFSTAFVYSCCQWMITADWNTRLCRQYVSALYNSEDQQDTEDRDVPMRILKTTSALFWQLHTIYLCWLIHMCVNQMSADKIVLLLITYLLKQCKNNSYFELSIWDSAQNSHPCVF